jgi:hypothetical protein
MGVDQMIKDWLGCSLAARMDLPVATAAFVDIPDELAEGQTDLVAGISFGSREVAPARHCTTALLEYCNPVVSGRILLFDWWTKNNDRYFSQLGGNANLLFIPHKNEIVMIDEDNAFDEEFNADSFWNGHGLRQFREPFLLRSRETMTDWLRTGLSALPELWNGLPPGWLENEGGDARTALASESFSQCCPAF